MKTLIALLFCATSSFAASAGITVPLHVIRHPVQAFHETSSDKWLMAASTLTLETANVIDYATTYRAVVIGTNCEENPVFQTAPCSQHNLNEPRFTGAKIGIAAFGFVQYLPKAFGWHNETWNRTFIIMNFAGTVPLAIVDINNIRLMNKGS